jgi:ATP-binding cassette subfamily F protein uup
MSVLTLADVTFGFGTPPLIQGITLGIEPGERVGLVGRNGVGKSTLLRLIAGELHPEAGMITFSTGAKAAYLTQHVPSNVGGTVFEKVAEGLGAVGEAVGTHHRLSRKAKLSRLTDEEQASLDRAVARLSEDHSWERLHWVERTLSEMELEEDHAFDSLSAGKKRRVLLARAIVDRPDVLLLDEPTNHLDIDSIVWLENFLLKYGGTVIFITHDRAFLQRLATRVVELERGRLFDFKTDYRSFLRYRDELLEAEAKQEAQFDKKLAEEERWLRQGVKARRKRNEGRVKALMAMRQERQARRTQVGSVRMQALEASRSGQRVVQAEAVTFSYGERRSSGTSARRSPAGTGSVSSVRTAWERRPC